VTDPLNDDINHLPESLHLLLRRAPHAHAGQVQRAPDVGGELGPLRKQVGYTGGEVQVALLRVQWGGYGLGRVEFLQRRGASGKHSPHL
jgi:hypothetical protein